MLREELAQSPLGPPDVERIFEDEEADFRNPFGCCLTLRFVHHIPFLGEIGVPHDDRADLPALNNVFCRREVRRDDYRRAAIPDTLHHSEPPALRLVAEWNDEQDREDAHGDFTGNDLDLDEFERSHLTRGDSGNERQLRSSYVGHERPPWSSETLLQRVIFRKPPKDFRVYFFFKSKQTELMQ